MRLIPSSMSWRKFYVGWHELCSIQWESLKRNTGRMFTIARPSCGGSNDMVFCLKWSNTVKRHEDAQPVVNTGRSKTTGNGGFTRCWANLR
jgi:hypothetical protein